MPASGSPKLKPGNPYPALTPNPTFGVDSPLLIVTGPTGLGLDEGRGADAVDPDAAGAGGELCAKHHCLSNAA